MLEARKLALEETSSFFGIDPSLVGSSANANYSNVSAYRAILWEDQLGGDFTEIEQIFNQRLVPVVANDPDAYCEFFVKGKVRMAPREQADLYLKATGRPWQTTAEIRAAENLPDLNDPNLEEILTPIYIQDPEALDSENATDQETSE
jgi:phage portal protein BeeE